MQLPRTIAEAATWLRNGNISSVELTKVLLTRCHDTQDGLAAFITICEKSALTAAQKSDRELAQGIDRGPLHGIPLAVKDNISTVDAPTTANSKAVDPDWAEGIDATVVRNLRQAGAIIMGKLGLYEFGFGPPDPATDFPITRNPWDQSRIPGGSSSGTAAAVAAGLILGGLGTDTGGSIRVPASFCGICGLKPTFGRVSKQGCVPGSYSQGVIGPMARTAHDCALMLEAIAGYDPADPNTANIPMPDMVTPPPDSLKNIRLGLPRDFFFTVPELDSEVKAAVLMAVEQMAAAGAIIIDIHIPHLAEAYAAWWVTTFAELYAYHEPGLKQQPGLYGPATRQSILMGALLSATDYLQAQRMRSYIGQECVKSLADVDALIIPCTTGVAPTSEEWDHFSTPSFTSLWSLLGYPVLALGCGFSKTCLPIGMQIVGKPFAEKTVLSIGHAYQQISSWHQYLPELAKDLQGYE